MAKHEVGKGEVGAYALTLTPNAVDEVVFDSTQAIDSLEVLSDGAAAIYFTTDGSEPTVGGANCHEIPAVRSVRVVNPYEDASTPTVSVKLISVGAPEFSVSKL